jgi:hypothetical protein
MPVLDLGHVPLANALLTAQQLHEPEDRSPLEFLSAMRLLAA